MLLGVVIRAVVVSIVVVILLLMSLGMKIIVALKPMTLVRSCQMNWAYMI